jgi:small-conductance mechanosensitive channel
MIICVILYLEYKQEDEIMAFFENMPLWLRIIFTVAVTLLLFLFYFFQRKLAKSAPEDQPKLKVFLVYVLDMVLFIVGVMFLLLVWDFDFTLLSADVFGDIEAFVMGKLGVIIGSVVTVFVTMMILKISKIAFTRFGNKVGPTQKRKRTIAKITQSIIKYLVSIVAILVVLSLWGVNVLPALAGLGIMGLVIGLGAQKFINDLITGIFIVFEQHFDVGDVIEVAGFKGEVISIGLKTTKIRNWKGEVKILANGAITDLTNFSLNPSTAVVEFGIPYKEDIDKVIGILKKELPKTRANYPEMLENPTILGITDLASNSVVIRVIAKTESEKHYAIERELRRIIKATLDQNGIEIPFQRVVVHQAHSE